MRDRTRGKGAIGKRATATGLPVETGRNRPGTANASIPAVGILAELEIAVQAVGIPAGSAIAVQAVTEAEAVVTGLGTGASPTALAIRVLLVEGEDSTEAVREAVARGDPPA